MASDKPGITHVRVLYDYKYTFNEGVEITIKTGEEYILKEKATNEWWLVQKADKKDIYVPSNYVEEIHGKQQARPKPKAPPPPPPKPKFSKIVDHALSNLDKAISFFDSEDESEDVFSNSNKTVTESSGSSGVNGDSEDQPKERIQSETSEPEPDYDEPLVVNEDKADEKSLTEAIEVDSVDSRSPGNTILRNPRKTTSIVKSDVSATSQNKAEVRESCMGKVKTGIGKFELPQYENPAELRQKSAERSEEKEEIKTDDSDDDLPDYANITQIRQANLHVKQQDVAEEDSKMRRCSAPPPSMPPTIMYSRENSTQSDIGEIPFGWEQTTSDAGEVFYIHPNTHEKWQCSQDKAGRQYFYSTDSSTSSWSLPENGDRKLSLPVTLSGLPPQIAVNSVKTAVVKQSHLIDRSLSHPDHMEQSTDRVSLFQWALIEPLYANMTRPTTWSGRSRSPTRLIEEDSSGPLHTGVASRISTLDTKHVADGLSGSLSGNVRNQPTRQAPEPPKPVEKTGPLNKAKVMENGKKVKKNWSPSWVLTVGPKLLFYKDQKATQQKSNSMERKPEFTLDLHDAKVERGTKEQKTSKKNVLQLETRSGTICMLQNDDSLILEQWYLAIKQNIYWLEKSVKERSTSESGILRKGKKSKEVGKLEETGEKRNVKDKLKMWLKRRPTLESLKESGIYNTIIFGSHLQTICEREETTVPIFVTNCVNIIKEKGLQADGIYRISGNQSDIQKLRFYIDQSDNFDLTDSEWDIHVLTGVLKLFFRELMEPLIPFRFLDRFINAMQIADKSEKVKKFRDEIRLLPDPNRDTLKFFTGHLVEVLKYSQENRMQAHSLAIVFGPTLMWAESKDSTANMAVYQTNMVYQGQIVEYLIQEYHNLH